MKKVMKVERQQSTDQIASQSSVKSWSWSEKNGEEQGEAQFNEDDHRIELLYLVSPWERDTRVFPTPQAWHWQPELEEEDKDGGDGGGEAGNGGRLAGTVHLF